MHVFAYTTCEGTKIYMLCISVPPLSQFLSCLCDSRCSMTKIRVLDASGPPGLPNFLRGASESAVTTAISALSFSPDGEVKFMHKHIVASAPNIKVDKFPMNTLDEILRIKSLCMVGIGCVFRKRFDDQMVVTRIGLVGETKPKSHTYSMHQTNIYPSMGWIFIKLFTNKCDLKYL